jgi:hypothetical protein
MTDTEREPEPGTDDHPSSEPGGPWWVGCAPLELTVSCGGQRHRLVWAQGRVTPADHPELDAERALIALGGEEPPCLAYLDLWTEAVTDGGFLAEWVDEAQLNAARLSWLTMALERMRNEGFHEFLRHLPPARAERMGHFLHRFPRQWHDRAAAAVAAAVVEGAGVVCTDAPGLVPAAIASRLRRAFVTSVGGSKLAVGAAALVPLSIRCQKKPAVAGRLTGSGRGITLGVPSRWLHRVWACGAAVTDHHLVLDLTIGPGRAGPEPGLQADAVVVSWTDEHGTWVPDIEHRTARLLPTGWHLSPLP